MAQHKEVWMDINSATPEFMQRSFAQRREVIASVLAGICADLREYNRLNPMQEPLVFIYDFTDDVEEAMLYPPRAFNAFRKLGEGIA